jgi:hypothetical protein
MKSQPRSPAASSTSSAVVWWRVPRRASDATCSSVSTGNSAVIPGPYVHLPPLTPRLRVFGGGRVEEAKLMSIAFRSIPKGLGTGLLPTGGVIVGDGEKPAGRGFIGGGNQYPNPLDLHLWVLSAGIICRHRCAHAVTAQHAGDQLRLGAAGNDCHRYRCLDSGEPDTTQERQNPEPDRPAARPRQRDARYGLTLGAPPGPPIRRPPPDSRLGASPVPKRQLPLASRWRAATTHQAGVTAGLDGRRQFLSGSRANWCSMERSRA